MWLPRIQPSQLRKDQMLPDEVLAVNAALHDHANLAKGIRDATPVWRWGPAPILLLFFCWRKRCVLHPEHHLLIPFPIFPDSDLVDVLVPSKLSLVLGNCGRKSV